MQNLSFTCLFPFVIKTKDVLCRNWVYFPCWQSKSCVTWRFLGSRRCRPCEVASSRLRPSDGHRRRISPAAWPPPGSPSARLHAVPPYLRTRLSHSPAAAPILGLSLISHLVSKWTLWGLCSPEWKSVSTRTFLALMNRPICSKSPRLTISWKMMSLGKCTVLFVGVTGITGAGRSCACVRCVELYREPLLYEGTYVDAAL